MSHFCLTKELEEEQVGGRFYQRHEEDLAGKGLKCFWIRLRYEKLILFHGGLFNYEATKTRYMKLHESNPSFICQHHKTHLFPSSKYRKIPPVKTFLLHKRPLQILEIGRHEVSLLLKKSIFKKQKCCLYNYM